MTETWTATGDLNVARSGHTATLLRNDKVLVVGGAGAITGVISSAELYDPDTGTWEATRVTPTFRTMSTRQLCSKTGKSLSWGVRARMSLLTA